MIQTANLQAAKALKQKIDKLIVTNYLTKEDLEKYFSKEDFKWVSKSDAKIITAYLIIHWLRRTNAVQKIMKDFWIKDVYDIFKIKETKDVPLNIQIIVTDKQLQWHMYEVQKFLLIPWLTMLNVWYLMQKEFNLTDKDIEDEMNDNEQN